uniref:MAGE domain-containing protein n=1 Tax=Oryza punctata TaxID=4537 RepID=A0A0E0M976_ORYPU
MARRVATLTRARTRDGGVPRSKGGTTQDLGCTGGSGTEGARHMFDEFPHPGTRSTASTRPDRRPTTSSIRRLPVVFGLAFVIISIVHLSDRKFSEGYNPCCYQYASQGYLTDRFFLKFIDLIPEDLWHQLRCLVLNESDENHLVLCSNKHALELLVQQRYMQKDKLTEPEGHSMMYEFAERALDESISGKLKDYISQVSTTCV